MNLFLFQKPNSLEICLYKSTIVKQTCEYSFVQKNDFNIKSKILQCLINDKNIGKNILTDYYHVISNFYTQIKPSEHLNCIF